MPNLSTLSDSCLTPGPSDGRLEMLGVPVEMVVYPREQHGFKERAHEVDLLRHILAWYDNYLKV